MLAEPGELDKRANAHGLDLRHDHPGVELGILNRTVLPLPRPRCRAHLRLRDCCMGEFVAGPGLALGPDLASRPSMSSTDTAPGGPAIVPFSDGGYPSWVGFPPGAGPASGPAVATRLAWAKPRIAKIPRTMPAATKPYPVHIVIVATVHHP